MNILASLCKTPSWNAGVLQYLIICCWQKSLDLFANDRNLWVNRSLKENQLTVVAADGWSMFDEVTPSKVSLREATACYYIAEEPKPANTKGSNLSFIPLSQDFSPSLVPQIAGSYRGSYFSMTGLLISEIAKWSRCRCRLVSQACLPSWFPFWPALGCRCRLVSQLVSLHGLFWAALGCCCRLVSQLVCLHDFPFGLFLAAAAALTPSLFSFLISLLCCSWLPLPPCLSAGLPSWFLFWAALGCRCRLVSQLVSLHDFPFGLLLAAAAALLVSQHVPEMLSGVYAGVIFLLWLKLTTFFGYISSIWTCSSACFPFVV